MPYPPFTQTLTSVRAHLTTVATAMLTAQTRLGATAVLASLAIPAMVSTAMVRRVLLPRLAHYWD